MPMCLGGGGRGGGSCHCPVLSSWGLRRSTPAPSGLPLSSAAVKGAHDIPAANRWKGAVKRWQLVVNWTVHKGMGQRAAAGG